MNTIKHQKRTAFFEKQKYPLLVVIIAFGVSLSTVKAQVGIGIITPNANAMLDVSTTNKGFLPPRVALTSRNSASPLGAFVAGMIVYNTATAGTAPNMVTPGVYYCNGTRWVRLIISRGDQTVDVGNIAGNLFTPNAFTGATFTPNAPANTDKIYIDTADGSTWTYNGATYDSYVEDPSTPFYLANGTNDAGANKTGSIYRTGNIGIGIATPHAPLQFITTTASRKIVLWEGADNDHQVYGFGVDPGTLRYQVSATSGSHVFYAGTSASASNELMRIAGTGNVGINNNNPAAKLDIIEDQAPATSADYSLSISATNNFRVAAIRLISGGNATLLGQNGDNDDGGLLANAAYWGAPAGGHDFQIITNSMQTGSVPTAALTIKDITNNIGIGISTPHAPLQFPNTVVNRKIVLWENADNDHQYFGFGINSNTLRYQAVGAHVFYTGTSATTSNELMRITAAGNVIIQGSCAATSFPTSSDARFKNNIQPYKDSALTQIMTLRPKTYTYKSDAELKEVLGITAEDKTRWNSKIGMPQGNQFGFIAQEVEQVIPQVVITDDAGFKGIDYGHLTPVLVKAIQEQQAEITTLQQQVADKDRRISELETKETAYAQLAAQVKEMQQMLGMKKKDRGISTAKKIKAIHYP